MVLVASVRGLVRNAGEGSSRSDIALTRISHRFLATDADLSKFARRRHANRWEMGATRCSAALSRRNRSRSRRGIRHHRRAPRTGPGSPPTAGARSAYRGCSRHVRQARRCMPGRPCRYRISRAAPQRQGRRATRDPVHVAHPAAGATATRGDRVPGRRQGRCARGPSPRRTMVPACCRFWPPNPETPALADGEERESRRLADASPVPGLDGSRRGVDETGEKVRESALADEADAGAAGLVVRRESRLSGHGAHRVLAQISEREQDPFESRLVERVQEVALILGGVGALEQAHRAGGALDPRVVAGRHAIGAEPARVVDERGELHPPGCTPHPDSGSSHARCRG